MFKPYGKNTEIVTFQGKGGFFQHLQQGDNEYKNWNVRLYFDEASLSKFKQLQQKDGEVDGIMNELKQDADGAYFHHFKRPFFKDFGRGDEPLLPPEILNRDDTPWDRNTFIGNGSDITVGCEIYQFTNRRTKRKGKAIRLSYVRVDNLVPYSRDDYTDAQKRMTKGVDQVPPQ